MTEADRKRLRDIRTRSEHIHRITVFGEECLCPACYDDTNNIAWLADQLEQALGEQIETVRKTDNIVLQSQKIVDRFKDDNAALRKQVEELQHTLELGAKCKLNDIEG